MSKVLSFDQVQKGLEKLSNVGLIEETLEVHGITFCLRTLRTRDHKKVNAYVGSYMEQYEGEDASYPLDATMDFFTVRKIEPLCHSIQVVGELDFHDVEYIETGDIDDNGNMIKKPKHVFVRQLLRDMDISVIEVLHRKYADLLVEAEERAADKVKFRDPEEELEQVEARRRELYEELDRELPEEVVKAEESWGDKQPEESVPMEKPQLSMDALKKVAFSPISDEDAEQILHARESVPHEEPEEEESDQQSFEAGGQKFIRLDDPDTPYTEEEIKYHEEQERMFQQRFGPKEDDEGPSSDAKARLQQKRRGPRQPLNQAAPQIHEGNLPSKEQKRPVKVQKAQDIDLNSLPIAEGFEEQTSSVLGSQKKGPAKPSYNPAPKGNRNPNFDPKK